MNEGGLTNTKHTEGLPTLMRNNCSFYDKLWNKAGVLHLVFDLLWTHKITGRMETKHFMLHGFQPNTSHCEAHIEQ